jgi:hypothetical protein
VRARRAPRVRVEADDVEADAEDNAVEFGPLVATRFTGAANGIANPQSATM